MSEAARPNGGEAQPRYRPLPLGGSLAATFERRADGSTLVTSTATDRWTAILSIVLQPPGNEAQLRKNPLGIYVNGLNWSRELGGS